MADAHQSRLHADTACCRAHDGLAASNVSDIIFLRCPSVHRTSIHTAQPIGLGWVAAVRGRRVEWRHRLDLRRAGAADQGCTERAALGHRVVVGSIASSRSVMSSGPRTLAGSGAQTSTTPSGSSSSCAGSSSVRRVHFHNLKPVQACTGAFCPLFRLHGDRSPPDPNSACGASGGPNEAMFSNVREYL